MPVSTSVQVSPARTRYTFTIVGRIGSGRWTRTTPSAISRALAASCMLLVHPLLDREREPDADAPGVHGAVLDDGRDAGNIGLPDAVDRCRGPRHGESDRVLDRVRRCAGEGDRLLNHR